MVHYSLSECQRRLLFKTLFKSFLFKSEIADTFPIYIQRYVLKSNILHLDDKMGEALIQPILAGLSFTRFVLRWRHRLFTIYMGKLVCSVHGLGK